MPTDHELSEREELMMDVYGGLLDIDTHLGMLMFTVGFCDDATGICRCQTMYWRCDN